MSGWCACVRMVCCEWVVCMCEGGRLCEWVVCMCEGGGLCEVCMVTICEDVLT